MVDCELVNIERINNEERVKIINYVMEKKGVTTHPQLASAKPLINFSKYWCPGASLNTGGIAIGNHALLQM